MNTTNSMQTKKKNILIPLILGIIVVCICVSPFLIIPAVNDFRANKIVHELTEHPLPPNAKIIEMYSAAGKLVGNGDGMDYFGAILIQSDVGYATVKQNYAASGYFVEKQDGQLIKQTDKKLYFKTGITGDNYYIIYKSKWEENPLFWVFDIRGA